MATKRSVKKRIEVFLKFHSSQVVLFFVALAAAWQVAPDDLKAAFFAHWPLLAEYKTEIALIVFLVSFYKARMNNQTVARKDLPAADKPEQVEPPKQE